VGRLHPLDQAIEIGKAEGKSESEIFRSAVGRKLSSVIAAPKPSRHVA
jgi:hypothetical protein